MTPRSRLADRVFLTVVGVLLLLPGLGTWFAPGLVAPLPERREPAPWPRWEGTLLALETWPRKFEQAFADRFGFRGALVRADRFLWLRGLGVSRSGKTVLGRDGWLFHRGQLVQEALGEIHPWGDEEVARAAGVYALRRRWLASQGIRYLAVPFPGKALVHPEKLPARLREAVSRSTRWGQMLEGFRRAEVEVLDLTPEFRQAAREAPVYLQTDFHWSGRGDLVAAWEMTALCRRVSGLPVPGPALPFGLRAVPSSPGRLLSRELDAVDLLREPPRVVLEALEEPPVEVLENVRLGVDRYRRTLRSRRPGARGRAMILADSFLLPFQDHLASFFAETTIVTLRWNQLPAQLIRERKPDVVIHAWWGERFLQPVVEEPLPVLEAEG